MEPNWLQLWPEPDGLAPESLAGNWEDFYSPSTGERMRYFREAGKPSLKRVDQWMKDHADAIRIAFK